MINIQLYLNWSVGCYKLIDIAAHLPRLRIVFHAGRVSFRTIFSLSFDPADIDKLISNMENRF